MVGTTRVWRVGMLTALTLGATAPLPVHGQARTNVASVPPACVSPTSRDASWSPDGERIVFTSDRTGSYDLWTIEPATGALQRLTEAEGSEFYPRYSRDGTRIAFTTIGSDGQAVALVDADGGEVRILTEPEHDAADPSWLADDRIVFAALNEGEHDLWTMRVDGGAAALLFSLDGTEWAPRISPAGDRISFHSDRGGDFDVYTARLDGTDLVRLSEGEGFDGLANWSPDGSRIAFYGRDAPTENTPEAMRLSWSTAEIRVVRAGGGPSRQLTRDDVRDQSPSWSPDGSRIAYTSCASGNLEIWLMDADGSNRHQLTRTEAVGRE